jgi:hypothetical protein
MIGRSYERTRLGNHVRVNDLSPAFIRFAVTITASKTIRLLTERPSRYSCSYDVGQYQSP